MFLIHCNRWLTSYIQNILHSHCDDKTSNADINEGCTCNLETVDNIEHGWYNSDSDMP